MDLTLEEVRHVARLARLRLSEEEAARLAREVAEVLTLFDALEDVACEPRRRVETPLRTDESAWFPDAPAIVDAIPRRHPDGRIRVERWES